MNLCTLILWDRGCLWGSITHASTHPVAHTSYWKKKRREYACESSLPTHPNTQDFPQVFFLPCFLFTALQLFFCLTWGTSPPWPCLLQNGFSKSWWMGSEPPLSLSPQEVVEFLFRSFVQQFKGFKNVRRTKRETLKWMLPADYWDYWDATCMPGRIWTKDLATSIFAETRFSIDTFSSQCLVSQHVPLKNWCALGTCSFNIVQVLENIRKIDFDLPELLSSFGWSTDQGQPAALKSTHLSNGISRAQLGLTPAIQWKLLPLARQNLIFAGTPCM